MDSLANWLALLAIVATILPFAWAAYQNVLLRREEAAQRKFNNFFATISKMNNVDRSYVSQAGAIFELRNYPEYAGIIVRLCNQASVLFQLEPNSDLLKEFELTAEHLRHHLD